MVFYSFLIIQAPNHLDLLFLFELMNLLWRWLQIEINQIAHDVRASESYVELWYDQAPTYLSCCKRFIAFWNDTFFPEWEQVVATTNNFWIQLEHGLKWQYPSANNY